MNVNNFVVVTLYPNGEIGRDRDGIWFRSPTPVVFQIYPVVTLEELKSVILRNMGLGAVGTSLVRRVAYRLLNVFPPDPFKFKIFWVDSDEHVRALFDMHRRYGTREVMELLTEMQSMPEDVGVIPCSPIHCPGPEVPMPMDGVKNYNIRRASEYRVVESDQYKYVCRCKQGEGGCPWEVRRFGGPHECLAPSMSSDHAQLDGRLICNVILLIIKSNPSVRIPVLQAAV
ncbi:hypothetical protein PIB30_025736 [Stylosanthes scabra]|uniref:Transposase MuDR plant domain-containing protein n=1 Tax=Stylosanthes scabra TaxID=79078 RepID=A0ABU6Q9T6_9FABA|nr:hypothetical protein [Stylosanthes scabra]